MVGEWNGQGCIQYSDENKGVYDGEIKSGRAHGKGIVTFSDGRTFECTWFEGAPRGHGKMTLADGEVFEARW